MMVLDEVVQREETLLPIGQDSENAVATAGYPHHTSQRLTLNDLPFDNSFARLPANFYRPSRPQGMAEPYVVAVSAAAADLLHLDVSEFKNPEFAGFFSGNALIPGSEPLAAVYSGHQFGDWVGQLGDGRAHLLGEVKTPSGACEVQLKGSGQTPYARGFDGRAVLRSSIREFLCSEAMAALGVPTTRALCVIGSDVPVQRETLETAAVVTRLAPSFVRFGSFQHWSSLDKDKELKLLADYIIDKFIPALRDESQPYSALLRYVAARTGELIAHWQAVGFMHGVMNTDNMSVLGLTLDYGPFGFMEAFDAGHVCNHSDRFSRYSYRAQPRVAKWNLYALSDALLTLIGHPDIAKAIVDEHYEHAYQTTFKSLMQAKLGLLEDRPDDDDFIAQTLGLLQAHRPDYTLFFRLLSRLPGHHAGNGVSGQDAPVRDLFLDREACDTWLELWRLRLRFEQSDDRKRQTAMLAVNPKYILRNWVAEAAIKKAHAKDFSGVAEVLQCLQQPYDEHPALEHYAALPPDWANGLAVSCSS
jgi:serine/tyrosine/threonine adenylyltransferase